MAIPEHSPLPTVVLLHGLARTHRSVDLLRKFLEKHGFPTWSQTYPSRSLPLDQLASQLADNIRAEVQGEMVAVTHSLGGILVRHMADKIAFSRVVMLAPPNNGSRVAQVFAGHPLFRWFYGPVGQQMALSENWPLPQSQVGVIAGTNALTLTNPISWVTRSFGILPRDEPSDGTITVAETKLAHAADFATVDASHTWIMNHSKARDMTVQFLKTGHFTFALLLGLLLPCAACSQPTPKPTLTDAVAVAGDDQMVEQPSPPDGSVRAQSFDGTADYCKACIADSDCAGGNCVQFPADSFCAPRCDGGCVGGLTCESMSTTEGASVQVCTSKTDPCGANREVKCPKYAAPATASCCNCSGGNCTANGCYNGWYCRVADCACFKPDEVPICAMESSDASNSDAAADAGSADVDLKAPVANSIDGGELAAFDFAIVGDTRPAFKEATNAYPTAIISKIWLDVAQLPQPVPFALTTGDYIFAKPESAQSAPQLDLYLKAQAAYGGQVWHAMGNHECTSATASNCGPYGIDGMTLSYKNFIKKMVAPTGVNEAYYMVQYRAKDKAWTAKIVVIAANAWSDQQGFWLHAAMSQPTTYTIVLRHESSMATSAPGVTPSQSIIGKYPYTMLIVGHTHTYQYLQGQREVIVGNGGAPLTSGKNYGYVVVRQRPDTALEFRAFEYMNQLQTDKFAVLPAGNQIP